jgi:hypothetical protein
VQLVQAVPRREARREREQAVTQPANTHAVQPPPQTSTLVRNVAIILASYASIAAMAEGIEVLTGASRSVLVAAIGLTQRGSAARPRPRMAAHGLHYASESAQLARDAADDDLYFRAAYVLSATQRMQEAIGGGKTLPEAVADEARWQAAHEAARRGRLDAAAKVAAAATKHGNLLGWYLDPDLNNEIECILASGNNFYADRGTVIGLPGSVHPRCGCHAGAPHEAGGMVDDAVAPVLTSAPARLYRLAG